MYNNAHASVAIKQSNNIINPLKRKDKIKTAAVNL